MKETLFIYAVRNQDGKWFRAYSQGGRLGSWVDSLSDARVYPKVGPARACVTRFLKYGGKPAPHIYKLRMVEYTVEVRA